jgi:hypothetical protein
MATALATRPVVSLVAEVAGVGMPRYVLPDQARAIINAAATTQHRLMLEVLWQSGGRLPRSCDSGLGEDAVGDVFGLWLPGLSHGCTSPRRRSAMGRNRRP